MLSFEYIFGSALCLLKRPLDWHWIPNKSVSAANEGAETYSTFAAMSLHLLSWSWAPCVYSRNLFSVRGFKSFDETRRCNRKLDEILRRVHLRDIPAPPWPGWALTHFNGKELLAFVQRCESKYLNVQIKWFWLLKYSSENSHSVNFLVKIFRRLGVPRYEYHSGGLAKKDGCANNLVVGVCWEVIWMFFYLLDPKLQHLKGAATDKHKNLALLPAHSKGKI